MAIGAQAFGYKFFFQLIKSDFVDLAANPLLPNAGLGAGKFINNTTVLPNTNSVISTGSTPADFRVFCGAVKTVTTAALNTNVVTLTFAAAHGFAVNDIVVVKDLPSPFTALNGTFTVTAVSSSAPHTVSYALTAANIASATVTAGTVTGGLLKLDGTDAPIRLLGLQNCAPNESEGEDTVLTYDDEAQSFDTSIATSKSITWSLEGVTNHSDAAYKLMRIASRESVRNRLMIKYARIGPTGVNETQYGYGRFTGFEEQPPAGGIVRFSTNVRGYGPYQRED